ncbi:hypothetical protein V6N12_032603 [Hibiscus sabdariffa]|uniref:Uncharacterized protein n=1 Tax=Hibiscus sabdariffa TaxID=183260 RepID=A0ABR2AQL9_9ROSI
MIVVHGSTTEQHEVMAAKPPSRPLQMSVTDVNHVPMPHQDSLPKRVVNATTHPAKVVVTAVLPTALHWP